MPWVPRGHTARRSRQRRQLALFGAFVVIAAAGAVAKIALQGPVKNEAQRMVLAQETTPPAP